MAIWMKIRPFQGTFILQYFSLTIVQLLCSTLNGKGKTCLQEQDAKIKDLFWLRFCKKTQEQLRL